MSSVLVELRRRWFNYWPSSNEPVQCNLSYGRPVPGCLRRHYDRRSEGRQQINAWGIRPHSLTSSITSATYSRKRTGPSTEPWGTPQYTLYICGGRHFTTVTDILRSTSQIRRHRVQCTVDHTKRKTFSHLTLVNMIICRRNSIQVYIIHTGSISTFRNVFSYYTPASNRRGH